DWPRCRIIYTILQYLFCEAPRSFLGPLWSDRWLRKSVECPACIIGPLAGVVHRQSEDNPSSTVVEFANHAYDWFDQFTAASCRAIPFAAGFNGYVPRHLAGFFDGGGLAAASWSGK